MSILFNTLDSAAWQIKNAARIENEAVRARAEKLCAEIRDFRRFVHNIAEPVEFVKFSGNAMEFAHRLHTAKKRLCDGCGKDITLEGGWRFPQEPRKVYCTMCQDKEFRKQMDESYK